MGHREIVQKALAAGRKLLPEQEAYEICEEFEIPFPPSRFAENWREVADAGEALGYPLVLKIVSPEVIHKSDVGGVVVGIASPDALQQAYRRLLATVRDKAGGVAIDGVLVQKAMPRGVEVAVGGVKDEVFGPMVMFGSGGIWIEIFKDVSFRMAPFDQEEALRQIRETKVNELLEGFRGAPPCDLNALAQLIVKVGRLLCTIPELAELDFNPVLTYPEGCVVVDARMILSP